MKASRCSACLFQAPAILLILLALPCVLLLTSCSRDAQTAGAAPNVEAAAGSGTGGGRRGGGAGGAAGRGGGEGGAVPVTTAKALAMELPITAEGVGNVEAFSTVEIRTQVTGPLTSIEFEEGQEVTEGQLLFTIDSRPFDAAVRQAQTALAKDTATAENSQAQLKRYDDLFARGLMAKADHDTYASTVKALEETLNSDRGQIENAKLQLTYTKITAPIAGKTGALTVHKGSLVRTADAAPMVVINQLMPARVIFSLPATYLPAILAGQAQSALQAEAVAAGKEGTVSTGALSFIDNIVDTTTAAIKLKATFPNKDHSLWPGEFVHVRVRLSVEPHAIVVPTSAVQNGQQGQFVYVVGANRTVAIRPVKVARSVGNNVVIAEGLNGDEEVVTDGQLRLTPGARISVRQKTEGS